MQYSFNTYLRFWVQQELCNKRMLLTEAKTLHPRSIAIQTS